MATKHEIREDKAAKLRFQLKAAKGIASVKTNGRRCEGRRPDRTAAGAQPTVRWEELMKKAMGTSAAAAIALTLLCISPAQADAEDPCVSVPDPAAHQACIDKPQTDDSTRGPRMGDCQASPNYGQLGQFCRNFWVRKATHPNAPRSYVERIKNTPAPAS